MGNDPNVRVMKANSKTITWNSIFMMQSSCLQSTQPGENVDEMFMKVPLQHEISPPLKSS